VHLDDVRRHLQPGLPFDDYVDMISRSGHLALPAGESPDVWAARRRRHHIDRHVMFNVSLTGDRWVQVSEHRTTDGGTVILQTDVTDIIRLERTERGKLLDDQAQMIRATLEHIKQGISIFDASGLLVWWNQQLGALLAIPMRQMRVGVSFDSMLQRFASGIRYRDGLTPALLEVWGIGGALREPLNFEIRRETGQIIDVFAQGMPDGGFVMSFSDVTAEREAIEALSQANETLEARVTERTLELEDALAGAERANASRSRFVAAASHDLLQPLSAAKLFISSIADEAIAPSARTALEKAQNALVSVEGILDALLDISKLESGKAAVLVGSVRLDRLLAQLNDEFAAIAAAKGLRLVVKSSDAVVLSDPAYLRRILQNLIGNAIRYTARGRVLVGARNMGGMIRIEVWDTGPGIPEEEHDNIFREFHRLNARASASEGMGLGLAIVERACALLAHPLSLASRVGRGTVFCVQVPRSDAPRIPDSTPVLSTDARSDPVGRIALLVENDEELRRALGLLLDKWGISVVDAASGEEALALIDEIGILPDFMLVDYQLGSGMTGVGFIEAMRELYGDLPTRIITANRTAEVRDQCRSAEIGMLMKPIDARALDGFLATLP
jgi:two-component system, sensor histidine kinase